MNAPLLDQKYCIGIPEMDMEHAHWVKLIRDFRAFGASDVIAAADRQPVLVALEHLISYTQRHFRSEEDFLAAQEYPYLEVHQTRHRVLEASLIKLRDRLQDGLGRAEPTRLNMLATVWLLDHITSDDWDYAQFLRARQRQALQQEQANG